ncbi:MAG: hypothetical protein AAFY48_04765 [Bacteroidota bacterium]
MSEKSDRLASLLEDYPELGTGLHEFMDEEENQLVGLVGIFSVLQLRLRSVLSLLPQVAPSEEDRPGPGH